MSTVLEALELEIERVYGLRDRLPGLQTLWLTRCATLHWCEKQPGTAVEVGTYTASVELGDLRGDVFHTFEAMKGRRHG